MSLKTLKNHREFNIKKTLKILWNIFEHLETFQGRLSYWCSQMFSRCSKFSWNSNPTWLDSKVKLWRTVTECTRLKGFEIPEFPAGHTLQSHTKGVEHKEQFQECSIDLSGLLERVCPSWLCFAQDTDPKRWIEMDRVCILQIYSNIIKYRRMFI